MDYTPVVSAVMTGLAAVVTALFAVLTPAVVGWLKARTTVQQRDVLSGVAYDAVYYAERLGVNPADRLAKAEAYAAQQMNAHGIPVDPKVLEDVIESTLSSIKGVFPYPPSSGNHAPEVPASE